MKLIFYNLQSQEIFANTMKSYITNQSKTPGGKYSYLFNEFYDLLDEIYIYDGKNFLSSMNIFNIEKIINRRFEIKFWLKINGFKNKKVKFISNLDNLNEEYLIFGCARTLLYLENLDELINTKAKKVFFLTHFFFNPKKQSNLLEKINVDLLVSENNLYRSSNYFKKYFNFYKKDVFLNSFVPQKRFVSKKKFEKRKKKMIITGTWRNYSGENFQDFMNFYNVETLHPGRKEIALNIDYLKNEIDNYMSNDFDSDTYKVIDKKENFFFKTYKRFYNVFKVKKSYFKIDLVESYNNYQMAIIPEEVVQVPGIGFFEAMACGCVCFGKADSMYLDLGLIPGKHYVTYKNLEDLKRKINYFQKNQIELKKIQINSLLFVRNKLNSRYVVKKYFKYLNSKFH
jgi:hypothetical protein